MLVVGCYSRGSRFLINVHTHTTTHTHTTPSEPLVFPYKLAVTVHVPSGDVGLSLTPQKLRFPSICIKPHVLAPKKLSTATAPSRPLLSCRKERKRFSRTLMFPMNLPSIDLKGMESCPFPSSRRHQEPSCSREFSNVPVIQTSCLSNLA